MKEPSVVLLSWIKEGTCMRHEAIRLTRGDDLKEEIRCLCDEMSIKAGYVVSAVGCVSRACIRLADGETVTAYDEPFEIVSLMGTISENGPHLHISLADREGNVIGGHLMDGCIINTTCEIVLMVLEEYSSYREYDQNTGYKEIVFKEMR